MGGGGNSGTDAGDLRSCVCKRSSPIGPWWPTVLFTMHPPPDLGGLPVVRGLRLGPMGLLCVGSIKAGLCVGAEEKQGWV